MMLLGVLAMGRVQAERRFTETFTFFSESYTPPAEGQIDPVLVETNLYVGVLGRVKFPSLNVSERDQGGQLLSVQSPEVHVAVGATPNIRADHFCRVTASTADSSLVGRKFRIAGLPASGQVTAARFPVEAVS